MANAILCLRSGRKSDFWCLIINILKKKERTFGNSKRQGYTETFFSH